MSSMRPTIAAMKKTLIAARNGSSPTFPSNFWRPTTKLTETESAKGAAIPPSSGTECFDRLLTSRPTIPPAFIFLIRGGIATRTRTAARTSAINAPRPSPKSRLKETRVWLALPKLVAGHSTKRYPVDSVFQSCFVVLAVDTGISRERRGTRGGIHTRACSLAESHGPSNPSICGRIPRGGDRRWYVDLALGPG